MVSGIAVKLMLFTDKQIPDYSLAAWLYLDKSPDGEGCGIFCEDVFLRDRENFKGKTY